MQEEDFSLSNWVNSIRTQYPYLEDTLTPEIERSRLETLSEWRDRVRKLQHAYDSLPEEMLPIDETSQINDGRVVVPTTMSIDTMTENEKTAWHELFSCVAPQLGRKAHKYWRAHGGEDSTLMLGDVLNYLPIVFLYVLANYDENRSGDNDGEFAEEEGRTRLTTWIEIEARRHIKTYLQDCGYLIGRGSGYLHRLRTQIRQIQNEHYAQHGEKLDHGDLLERVRKRSYYGRSISREALSSKVRELQSNTRVVSTEDAVGGDANTEDMRVKDVTPSDPITLDEDTKQKADIQEYIRERTSDNSILQSACLKILNSKEPLTVEERFRF